MGAVAGRPGMTAMANCWIFQANPRRFDIHAFLKKPQDEFEWLVERHKEEIARGDNVFLWAAIGGGDRTRAGVVALAEVRDGFRNGLRAPEYDCFWHDQTGVATPVDWAQLEMRGIAANRNNLSYDAIKSDPILRDMEIMKLPRGTNFRVSKMEADRLLDRWDDLLPRL